MSRILCGECHQYEPCEHSTKPTPEQPKPPQQSPLPDNPYIRAGFFIGGLIQGLRSIGELSEEVPLEELAPRSSPRSRLLPMRRCSYCKEISVGSMGRGKNRKELCEEHAHQVERYGTVKVKAPK